jgi:general secretion pathway protein J
VAELGQALRMPLAAASISFANRVEGRPQSETAGFTLLEILVALAVLGFLLIGLVQGSRFVLFGWETHSRLLERNADLDAIDRMLRHVIEQAKPASDWERLAFTGSASSVTFTSIMPVSAGEPPTRRADVELIVDAGHRLLLVWTPHLHATRTGRDPRPQSTEILQGVERLELAYLSATQAGVWTRVWHDPMPPRLVRIRIVFADAKHPRWPDIVAAPMIDPS